MAGATFASIGLDEKLVAETLKNESLTAALLQVLQEAGFPQGGCERAVGVLLYAVAARFPPKSVHHRALLSKHVATKKIATMAQVEGALEFFKKSWSVPAGEINTAEFEAASGVGIVVTDAQIRAAVADVLARNRAELESDRYRAPIGKWLGEVREKHPWGDGRVMKEELDRAVLDILGPRTDADNAKPAKKAAPKEKEAPKEKPAETEAEVPIGALREVRGAELDFPMPEENQLNTPALLKKHLAETGGIIVTRFPPEPNGYLHVGHAKAISLDFGFAEKNGGKCYLRYDDTNPDAEKTEFMQAIEADVAWLGHTPTAVTYSSDYFPQLYDFAIKLIKKGLAYVCHQTSEEIAEGREKKENSPWRDRPIAENLREFENMRKGKYEEGKAILRMKMDMQHDNPCMRDLIAYRIKYTPHPHVGDKWCIYPSYDYTHCIIDSLENITHSLCTLEFQVRQISYYWLLDALEIYKPIVWEYARLNITHTVMSKRRLTRLVSEKYVDGWDDPRMPSICGMRRRGYPAAALNEFCSTIGVTRSNSTTNQNVLFHSIRTYLDNTAMRRFAVMNPLRVVITNHAGDFDVEAPNFPKNPAGGSRTLTVTKVVFIDHTDFRMQDSKDFFGLAPNKEVGLKYAGYITCRDVVCDAAGTPIELRVTFEKESPNKVKGHIHWLGDGATTVRGGETRVYEDLFLSENPGELENWLEDLNPHSKTIISGCLFEADTRSAAPGTVYQFERIGFFCKDPDSTADHVVFNRTVSLKDSYNASAPAPAAAPSKKK